MNYFSKNIRALRTKSGLKQSDMLDNLGIARTTWSSYENGVSQPDIDGILKIAYFFQVSIATLLDTNLEAVDPHTLEQYTASQNTNESANSSSHEVPANPLLTDPVISEVLQAKQQVIDTQAETIRTLTNFIETQLTKKESLAQDGFPDRGTNFR